MNEDEEAVGSVSACDSCPPAEPGKMVVVFSHGSWQSCSSDCPPGSICSLPLFPGTEGECRELDCMDLEEVDLSNYHLLPKRPDEYPRD